MVVSTWGGNVIVATPIITNTGTYNYGSKTESNNNVRYTAMSGLYRTGDEQNAGGQTEWRGWEYAFFYNPTGTVRMYGGLVQSSRPIQFGRDGQANADVIIEKTKFVKVGTEHRREIRFDSATGITGSVDMIIDGFQVSHRALPADAKFTILNGQIVQLSRGPSGTSLTDLDASQNIDRYTDLGTDSDSGNGNRAAKTYTVQNSVNGSDLRLMPKSGVGDVRQLGILIVTKEVEYKFADASGTAIEGVRTDPNTPLSLIHI